MMNPDEPEYEYLTREQALQVARAEAIRDLTETDTLIRYVTFVSELDDYCMCQFELYKDGWSKQIWMLPNNERLPGEEIPDERILAHILAGNRISAVRLYRAKHEVGLREAVDGVEAMRNQAYLR